MIRSDRGELWPRLATAMIYLKTAEAGGRTVFPLLSLSVPASPLALLFWHNLTPDLQADTRHTSTLQLRDQAAYIIDPFCAWKPSLCHKEPAKGKKP